jgi:hypothetical protein
MMDMTKINCHLHSFMKHDKTICQLGADSHKLASMQAMLADFVVENCGHFVVMELLYQYYLYLVISMSK